MLSNKQNSRKFQEPSKYPRPIAALVSFFYPVSKQELEQTFKNNQEILDRTGKLIEETDDLHREIDVSLSTKP